MCLPALLGHPSPPRPYHWWLTTLSYVSVGRSIRLRHGIYFQDESPGSSLQTDNDRFRGCNLRKERLGARVLHRRSQLGSLRVQGQARPQLFARCQSRPLPSRFENR